MLLFMPFRPHNTCMCAWALGAVYRHFLISVSVIIIIIIWLCLSALTEYSYEQHNIDYDEDRLIRFKLGYALRVTSGMQYNNIFDHFQFPRKPSTCISIVMLTVDSVFIPTSDSDPFYLLSLSLSSVMCVVCVFPSDRHAMNHTYTKHYVAVASHWSYAAERSVFRLPLTFIQSEAPPLFLQNHSAAATTKPPHNNNPHTIFVLVVWVYRALTHGCGQQCLFYSRRRAHGGLLCSRSGIIVIEAIIAEPKSNHFSSYLSNLSIMELLERQACDDHSNWQLERWQRRFVRKLMENSFVTSMIEEGWQSRGFELNYLNWSWSWLNNNYLVGNLKYAMLFLWSFLLCIPSNFIDTISVDRYFFAHSHKWNERNCN